MSRSEVPEPFVLADVAAWRAWLAAHEDASDGVWLVLAKKGVTDPTSITYAQALEEALCSGWIDGQRRGRDAATFLQRFTPRRARSLWSQRNVDAVTLLDAEGRLRDRGRAEVARAQADGRWERAYSGQASAEVPPELVEALARVPEAQAAFAALRGADRFSALFPILTATSAATRTRRIDALVARLRESPA
ncbi:YdeI/OmpD-associated family protein [Luteimicrobium sp. DT211]|uniref:YdeI/OmpD-associated family protein n=1 Tax=Luteimicrobium sp. DT211 TaxID=3393412 RepID=UPI003CF2CBE7